MNETFTIPDWVYVAFFLVQFAGLFTAWALAREIVKLRKLNGHILEAIGRGEK